MERSPTFPYESAESKGPFRSAPDLAQWAAHLRGIAEPAADVAGLRLLGDLEAPCRAVFEGIPTKATLRPADTGETALWWALADDRISIVDILSISPDGPLLPADGFRAIEVWTDAELSALHAFWNLARIRRRPDWQARAARAREWHLLHTQPDNATNRPWALHVFLLGATPECTHYAETLLHNCLALEGRPDPASAWILLDAARELTAAAN